MKKIIHRSNSRGIADHGWLSSRHTFSFAHYYHPERMAFGRLRVLNDDIVMPGQGFGSHAHKNMEITSIPLSGALKHKDNMGSTEVLKTEEVQVMSAGTGITHSEWNASNTETVNFLQIWILPKAENIKPFYEQMAFDVSKRQNRFQVLIAPKNCEEKEKTLSIYQNTWFARADLEAGHTLKYKKHDHENGVYLFLLEGTVEIEGENLEKRDAIGIVDEGQITLKAGRSAQILCIEVPMS